MLLSVLFCFVCGDCNFLSFSKEKSIHTIKDKLIIPFNSSLTHDMNVNMHMQEEAKWLNVENALEPPNPAHAT